jgi:hypothetical protein
MYPPWGRSPQHLTPPRAPVLALIASPGGVVGGPWQITPYMREIYIIQMIKNKINDHCNEVAANNA